MILNFKKNTHPQKNKKKINKTNKQNPHQKQKINQTKQQTHLTQGKIAISSMYHSICVFTLTWGHSALDLEAELEGT